MMLKFCDPIRPYQIIYRKITTLPLRKKCPCSELFCSAFSPNAGKYGPEQLRIRILFTHFTDAAAAFLKHSKQNLRFFYPIFIFSKIKCFKN